MLGNEERIQEAGAQEKKPGLRMGDIFVILWVFLRMPELKDEPGWLGILLFYPTLL